MRITKKLSDEFLSHLQVHSISIPDIQEKMGIGYKEAHNLIEYAIKRSWLLPCTDGNEYKTNPSAFKPKSLTTYQCQRIYDTLEAEELQVLYYFSENEIATFGDILENVDNNDDNMRRAIDGLIELNILVEYNGNYYRNITAKSIEKIKKYGKEDVSLRNLMRIMTD